MSAVQIFATGALAYNFTAMVVAPLYGIEMEPIELGEPNPSQGEKPAENKKHPSEKKYKRR